MDKVFTWINRINSMLLLLVLIGIGITVVLWNLPRDRSDRHVAVAASTGERRQAKPLVLGDAETINGTEILMVPLQSELGSLKFGSGSDYTRDMHNALFLAGGDGKAAWLFDTNANLIRELKQVHRNPQESFNAPTIMFYVEFASSDSDGDGEITHDDAVNVAFAKPDGSGLTEILRNVKRVLSYRPIDDRTLAVIYQVGNRIWHARFAMDTFGKISEQAVIDVPEL